jgi:hypothetical protein
LQLFGGLGQGVTTTIGAPEGNTSLYIDPGHLPRGAQGHITLYNPTNTAARVGLTLIDQDGRAVRTISMHLNAGRRAVVDLTASYHTANLGALIVGNVPIVAEKVVYFGQFKQAMVGGSDLNAVASPVTRVVFPGGTTAHGASNYLNLYNPSDTTVSATITVVYSGNRTIQRTVTILGRQRVSISVASLGAPAGSSSLIVEGAQGAKFYATQSIFNSSGIDGSEVSGIALDAQ